MISKEEARKIKKQMTPWYLYANLDLSDEACQKFADYLNTPIFNTLIKENGNNKSI